MYKPLFRDVLKGLEIFKIQLIQIKSYLLTNISQRQLLLHHLYLRYALHASGLEQAAKMPKEAFGFSPFCTELKFFAAFIIFQ